MWQRERRRAVDHEAVEAGIPHEPRRISSGEREAAELLDAAPRTVRALDELARAPDVHIEPGVARRLHRRSEFGALRL